MIVECKKCGAPLNVVDGQRLIQCSYCGATSQVKGMRTAAMQTPPGWQPPPTWQAPPSTSTSTSAPLTANVYRPSVSPPSSSNAGCLTGLGSFIALLAIGGGVAYTTMGGSFIPSVDLHAAPTAGTVVLGATPTTGRTFPAVANGSIAANRLSSACRGHFSSAPHLVLRVTTAQQVTITSRGTGDLTLAVRDPSGLWRCDDDGGEGTNPRLTLSLTPGVYPVWFGRYSESSAVAFEALVDSDAVGSVPLANGLAVASAPTLGVIALSGASSTTTREGVAGGLLSASTLGSNCRGYIPAVPHLSLMVRDHRRVVLTTASTTDLTMVVRDAAGALHCDDDSVGNQPRVETFAAPGIVQVWVGTYSQSVTRPPFTLSVQSDSTGDATPLANGLSPLSRPTVSALDLDYASPETHLAGLVSGTLPASSVAPGCAGYLSSAPQLRMTSASRRRVTVSASSHLPVMMLLRGPTGDMQCVDGRSTRTATLAADFPAGTTAVWVAPPSPGSRMSFRLDVTAQGQGAAPSVK